MTSKPYKVWSADRSTRKSLVAKTLEEVLNKGRTKLGYDSNLSLTLVMEDDGTEVDDEEYFQCLESGTVFLLLRGDEKWKPPGSASGRDEPDSGCNVQLDCADTDGVENITTRRRSVEELLHILKNDVTRVITFSNAEMESVANASEDKLCTLSGGSLQEVQHLQLTCQRYLDDRTKALEAMDLLKLVAQSRGEHGSGDGHKRQRTDC